MMDAVFAFMETNVVRLTIGKILPTRVGSRHPLSAPFDIYQCKDGLMIIAIASDPHFAKLCNLMGQPDLIEDPRFDSDPHRSEHAVALKVIIEHYLANYTVDEAMEVMLNLSLPCGPIQDVQQACEDPSILKREMLIEIDQPEAGKLVITGNPLKLSGTPVDPKHPAPLLGQDTNEILHDIFGYSQEQLAQWTQERLF